MTKMLLLKVNTNIMISLLLGFRYSYYTDIVSHFIPNCALFTYKIIVSNTWRGVMWNCGWYVTKQHKWIMLHTSVSYLFVHSLYEFNLKTFARSFAHKNISKYSVHWQRVADWLNADAGFQVTHMFVDVSIVYYYQQVNRKCSSTGHIAKGWKHNDWLLNDSSRDLWPVIRYRRMRNDLRLFTSDAPPHCLAIYTTVSG